MSIFKTIIAWLVKGFKSVKTDGAKIAVAITEGIQAALKTGIVDDVVKIIEAIFPTVQHLPEVIVAELKKVIPKVLAAELAVIGIPDNPTEADILAFEQRVLEAFNVHDNKSKLYTVLAAQIFGLLQKHTAGTSYTFAEIVLLIEQAYQDYKNDVADIGG